MRQLTSSTTHIESRRATSTKVSSSCCSPSHNGWAAPSSPGMRRRCAVSQNRPSRGWRTRAFAGWLGRRLQVSGTVQLADVTPQGEVHPDELDIVDEAEAIFAEMPDEPLAEKRLAALLDQPTPEMLWLGMAHSTMRLDLTERSTGETWPVTAAIHRMGLAASFSAEIDPNTLAAGARLADGLWDLYIHFGVFGVAIRRRARLTPERRPGRVLPSRSRTGHRR